MTLRVALLLIVSFHLIGCSLPFNLNASSKTVYVLTPDLAEFTSIERSDKRLAIRDILSSGLVNSRKVLFSKEVGQLGNYQFASWAEIPAKQLTDLLLLGVQKQGAFLSVSRTTSGSVSDLQLNAELLDFTHELYGGSSVTRAVLQVELINLQTRNVVAQKLFDIREEVPRNNVDGAVEGFNRATTQLIRELATWVAENQQH